jgi:tuftelin-interacting protein 11
LNCQQAQENGIVFLPTKRQHEGKQIYTFGSTSIYIDKDVIFAHSGANQWKPTSIESLLEKAKK